MWKRLKDNPLLRFLVLGGAAYLVWYILYEFLLRPQTNLDEQVIVWIVNGSEWLLSTLGYSLTAFEATPWMNRVGIEGAPSLYIGEACDGVALFALFSIFVIAFPGPLKHKLWYIPVGMFVVHWVNIIRVVALAIIVDNDPSLLQFNHDYTFTIIVYGVVFALWYGWIQFFSPAGKNRKTAAHV